MNSSSVVPAVTEAAIHTALGEVYDPEFGISVEDMGLIYEVRISGDHVTVIMTLTSMYCPASQMLVEGVRTAVAALPHVGEVVVDLVWEPVWTPEFLTPQARQHLGFDRHEPAD